MMMMMMERDAANEIRDALEVISGFENSVTNVGDTLDNEDHSELDNFEDNFHEELHIKEEEDISEEEKDTSQDNPEENDNIFTHSKRSSENDVAKDLVDVFELVGVPYCVIPIVEEENRYNINVLRDAGKKSYRCKTCSFVASSQKKIVSHTKRCLFRISRFMTCIKCSERFAVTGTYRNRRRLHFRAEHLRTKPYACDACEEEFDFRRELVGHMIAEHPKKRPKGCSALNFVATTAKGALHHKKIAVENAKRVAFVLYQFYEALVKRLKVTNALKVCNPLAEAQEGISTVCTKEKLGEPGAKLQKREERTNLEESQFSEEMSNACNAAAAIPTGESHCQDETCTPTAGGVSSELAVSENRSDLSAVSTTPTIAQVSISQNVKGVSIIGSPPIDATGADSPNQDNMSVGGQSFSEDLVESHILENASTDGRASIVVSGNMSQNHEDVSITTTLSPCTPVAKSQNQEDTSTIESSIGSVSFSNVAESNEQDVIPSNIVPIDEQASGLQNQDDMSTLSRVFSNTKVHNVNKDKTESNEVSKHTESVLVAETTSAGCGYLGKSSEMSDGLESSKVREAMEATKVVCEQNDGDKEGLLKEKGQANFLYDKELALWKLNEGSDVWNNSHAFLRFVTKMKHAIKYCENQVDDVKVVSYMTENPLTAFSRRRSPLEDNTVARTMISCNTGEMTCRFKCKLCGYSVNGQGPILSHVKGVHMKVGRLQCSKCSYSTYHNASLHQHVTVKHLGCKQFVCDFCNKGFYYHKQWSTHINAKHLNCRPFKCSLCNYSAASSTRLNRHKRIIHTTGPKVKCTLCNYEAKYKGLIRCHMKSAHSTERQFKCDLCNHTSKRSDNLRKHVKVVHEKEKKLKCDFCDMRFSQKWNISFHIKAVHLKGKQKAKNEEHKVLKKKKNETKTREKANETGKKRKKAEVKPEKLRKRTLHNDQNKENCIKEGNGAKKKKTDKEKEKPKRKGNLAFEKKENETKTKEKANETKKKIKRTAVDKKRFRKITSQANKNRENRIKKENGSKNRRVGKGNEQDAKNKRKNEENRGKVVENQKSRREKGAKKAESKRSRARKGKK